MAEKRVRFDGQTYVFPADATDQEIADALSLKTGPQPTEATATAPPRQMTVRQPRAPANLAQSVAQFVTGAGRKQPGVGEISSDPVPIQTPADLTKPQTWFDDMGRAAAIGAGFFLDPNEQSRAAIIKRQVPSAEFRRDEYGNLQARYTARHPWRYINAPGASIEDALTVGNEVVKFAGASRIPGLNAAQRTGVGVRAATAAGAGATATAGGQAAATALGGQGVKAEDTVTAATFAAGGQALGDIASLGYQGARNAISRGLMDLGDWIDARVARITPPQPGAPQTIDIQAAGRRVAEGLRTVGQQETARAQAAAATRGNGDYSLGDEFGVPLTRGEAARDTRQIAREQRYSRGGSTEAAEQVMRPFREQQIDALTAAGRRLATRGADPVADDVGQAGASLAQGLEARRAALDAAKSQQYNRAFELAGNEIVAPATVADLGARFRDRLFEAGSDLIPDDATLPAMRRALTHIDRLEELGKTGGVSFTVVERTRQALRRIRARTTEPTEQFGVDRVIQELDSWVDEYPFQNQAVQDALVGARQINRELKLLYAPRGAEDAGGKALERMLDTPDLTGRDIVSGILGNDLGTRQSALGAVRRIKEITLATRQDGRMAQRPGATSGARAFSSEIQAVPQELQALREAAIFQILRPIANRTPGQAAPLQTVRTNLNRALSNDGGGPIMEELFTPREIAAMRRYQALIEQMIPPAGTVNYSGTAYELSRMTQDTTEGFVSSVLGRPAAIVFSALWQAPKGAFEAAAARAAQTRPATALSSTRSPVPGAAVGYSAVQRNDDGY